MDDNVTDPADVSHSAPEHDTWRAAALAEIGECWVMLAHDDIWLNVCAAHEGGGWRREAEKDSLCWGAAWMLKAAEAAVEADRAQRAEPITADDECPWCPGSLPAPDHLDC